MDSLADEMSGLDKIKDPAMGFQRRTQNLINRFNNYWRDLP